jgi:hypothetical protein
MAIIANMVLADGQATPVNHTFTARGVKNGIATWKDLSGGIPAGYPTVTYSLRESTKATQAMKVKSQIAVPKLETSPSFLVPTEAYRCLLNIDAVLPDRCTDQDRKDLYAYGVSLLAHVVLSGGIKNGDAVW